MERYGIDRPDLRYGLELRDVSDVFRGADVRRRGARCSTPGGRVRGIRVPGGARFSRKQQDELDGDGEGRRARRGCCASSAPSGALEGPAAKFLRPEALADARR